MSDLNIEARILLALRALQNDPKLSLRRAAGIYQVRYWTLHRRKKGILSTRDSIPKSRKLSDLEEQIIVQFILDLDSRGFPPRLRCVEEMANRLLADREMPPVGKRWASNFVKRHKDLKTHFFRKYDYKRAKCEDPTIIRHWFRLVANVIAKYGIRPDEIYNFDETGFMMGVIASGMVVTAWKPGMDYSHSGDQCRGPSDPAVHHSLIGAGQYHLANWYRESSLPGDWAIATSPNGWTDNEIGLEWLKHFDRCTTKQSKNRYRLLILDGHESHHSVDFERYCKANKIITLCMPPHSSHLLQPLDVGCFGLLKKAYGREIEHLIRCSVTHISKTEFFPAFYTAYQATMTEKNIKAAFRGAGLAPLDPESVMSKLDVQLRTPTPAEEVVSPSTPWVSKTPKTILEADSQLEYLERRIKRHKSSSPESILEALRSSSKGTKIVMHKVALLEARVQDLEQANEILSRRRRAKRTQLEKGGVMTVEEGRQVIDQTDADAQAVAGPSRSGGQGGPARMKERRCGACGKTGHNARTCQIVVAMSLEGYSD
uniref:Transposase n=1 Tax=Fusarium oxysporum f. sp. lycopersici TaxID=59765 RepID=A0A0E3T4K7_FUSOX|nr:transposase [Fusarium oxysporum f. sp. lycopersici]